MLINTADAEILLSLAQEMASYEYRYIAYPLTLLSDGDTIQFFKTSMGAQDYCLVGPNDIDYFKSMPIDSLINNLKIVIHSGIHTYCDKELDLNGFARQQMESREKLENNLNLNTMNQKNLEFLKDQLKYTGFGETFDQDLKEKMLNGEKEFKLMKEGVYGTDSMTAVLNFKKSDQSDLYFFNSYHVNLKKEDSKEGLEQTFYISNNSSNITLKEAYNLMEGRSVNKDLKTREGEAYNSWLKIDFKVTDDNGNFKLDHYHQNYGYDLEASLEKHSIKELNTPKYKEDLLNSLKKGNLQSATFVVAGVESKMYVEANPQFKTVNVYDDNFQRINHRESKDQKKSELEGKSISQDSKEKHDVADEASENGEKGKKQKRKQTNSI